MTLLVTALAGGPVYSSPGLFQAAPSTQPTAPSGLKSTFMVGLANPPGNVGWMKTSGAAWDARYQYLVGGVNFQTNNNWATWDLPPGQFATSYIDESVSNGYLPVFTYYQIYQSYPGTGATEAEKDYNNLNNPSTTNAYFADFKLLMDRIKLSGKTVVVHIEPDLWGFLQKRSTNPSNISAAVASSGYADVASYPNTVAGFARALVGLRNKYAPNALLGYHISPWSSTYGDITSNTSDSFNTTGAAQETANFYLQTGANFDLLFYDIADRDSGYYASLGQAERWWDVTNTAFPNFNRFHQFAAAIKAATNKPGILWQVPVGNTLYRTMNNTEHHWQDNRVQYYLGPDNNQKLQDLADSGIIGLLYGAGDYQTTSYDDAAGDGITNPAAINGNTLTASYADDDGGNLRLRGKAYYDRGRLALANPPLNPGFASNPTPGATISLAASSGNTATSTINISNNGSAGTTLLVSAPTISGSSAGSFTASSGNGFSVEAGAAAWPISVTCNPTGAGNPTATLSYTTNDPARLTVSYNLSCSVQSARFSATPYAPGSTIEFTGQQSQTVSTTISISNSGSAGPTLNVQAPYLSNPSIFTVTPNTAFSLAQNAPPKVVTINCTPAGVGVQFTGTLSYSTNDPSQSTVTYNLVCNSYYAVTVTSPGDDGTGQQQGTLSQAFKTYTPNQLIVFAVSGNKITMSGTTPLTVNRGPVVIDGGGCTNGVPSLTIAGNNLNMAGLTLGSGVQIRNIMIENFAGPLIVVNRSPGDIGVTQIGRCVIARKA